MTANTQKDSSLEIVVINLARSKERRQAIEKLLKPMGLPYRFLDAVDGRAGAHPLFKHYDERQALMRRGLPLTANELGCYASHYKVWELCASEDRPVLLCEDDIEFAPDFLAAYQAASEKIEAYGMLRFCANKKRSYITCETIAPDLEIVRFKRTPLGGYGYAISPAAARSFLRHSQTWFVPVDVYIDRHWEHGVPSYGFLPPPITHPPDEVEQSDIRRDALPDAKDRNYRVRRLFYKALDEIRAMTKHVRYLGKWKSAEK